MKIPPLRSIHARLLLAIIASMLVALAIGESIIHELFKKRVLDDFDSALESDLTFHRFICVQEDDMVHLEYMTKKEARRQVELYNPVFVQYRFANDTRLIHHSPNLGGNDLPAIGLGSDEMEFRTIELFNGKRARAVGMEFYPRNFDDQPNIKLHVVIAKELTGVLASFKKMRKLLFQVAAGLTLLLMVSISYILRRNLLPLSDLSDQIGSTPVTGGTHFKLSGAPAELDPVVGRLNTLMDRVEGAFERERHFTANAAHELRNPLGGMRSLIELSLGGERQPEEYRDTLDKLYDIQQGMERVVENLLILARLESGEETAKQEIVPITEVLRRGWRKVFDAAEQKDLKVNWDIQNAMPPLKTARNLVSIIVRNLLDNAVDYSPDGGVVRISAHYDRLIQSATIRVANQNTSLTEEDCKKMFELFWRGDHNDSEHRHAGLGLGLCRRIVRILQGELKARLIEGNQMIEFVCTFPCEILGD